MVFESPSWAREGMPPAIPNNITVEQFMNTESFGRANFARSRNPYTCGITGRTYTPAQVAERVDSLARALSEKLNWHVDDGSEWDKIACVFSANNIDYIPVTHAVHRLNGIVTPASASYSPSELLHLLKSTGASVLFTCEPLLPVALEAAKAAGIPESRIFMLDVPGFTASKNFTPVSRLIEDGRRLAPLPALRWTAGRGERQVAYICFSSGTSGLPKGVMLSHHNIISNIVQHIAYMGHGRKIDGFETQVALGVLPFSHIYGLVIISHVVPACGDGVIVFPKYDLKLALAAVEKYSIHVLNLVPPIIVQMLQNVKLAEKYDLSSVRVLVSGAAPLGAKTVEDLGRIWPKWKVVQGYGMTECSPGVCMTSEHDTLHGTCGSILPATKCKLVSPEGREITDLETPGELLVQSPSVCLGYLNNSKATSETIVWDEDGRWLRTGDEVVIRQSPLGNNHVVVVDRIKELIKVKGHQVAPAELEAHLLLHQWVADCAVISVRDEYAGELPKAYIVKDDTAATKSDDEVATSVHEHVEKTLARYKWLKGGIEFIPKIPKSPSGKILRRELKDLEKSKNRHKEAKL